MKAGVLKETWPGETRVALVPGVVQGLAKAGIELLIEAGSGEAAGFPDGQYAEKGGAVVARGEVLERATLLLSVRSFAGAHDKAALDALDARHVLVGLPRPAAAARGSPKALAERGLTSFALELVPRISRAQSMDALSSTATMVGYKAVLLAAERLPRMMPMMMTAAGTIAPARVLVIGAGVAGLQAIATARRLGAVVEAYDVRPAVKEQVQSLGREVRGAAARGGQRAEDKGGYAKAQDEEFYRRQRELLGRVVAESDVVIAAAAVPGQKAPRARHERHAARHAPGSVIVDLAAEQGGNCEASEAGRGGAGRTAFACSPRSTWRPRSRTTRASSTRRTSPTSCRTWRRKASCSPARGRRDRARQHAHARRRDRGRARARGARHGAAPAPASPPERRAAAIVATRRLLYFAPEACPACVARPPRRPRAHPARGPAAPARPRGGPGRGRAADRRAGVPRPGRPRLPGAARRDGPRAARPARGRAAARARRDGAQPLPLRGAGLPRQHRGLLRPAQQLPERRARPPHRHPDHALHASTSRSARRAGLDVEGVGLPGHFVVRVQTRRASCWSIPFHGGALLSEEDCQKRLDRIFGGRVQARAEHAAPPAAARTSSRACCAT